LRKSAEKIDVIVIGAGASGLMCAIEAGNRGRRVLLLDHEDKVGQKITISGGGYCNFTNRQVSADNYISHNCHFPKSALNRYTQWDIIRLLETHKVAYQEKEQGHFFCEKSAQELCDVLLQECKQSRVEKQLGTTVLGVELLDAGVFVVKTDRGDLKCASLVIATGGLSFPSLGASTLGYKIAEQFNIKVWPPRAGLVPLRYSQSERERYSVLSGVAVDAVVRCGNQRFCDSLLFTHRGLSGPAILQLSSYWQEGYSITINLLPEQDLLALLKKKQQDEPQRTLKSVLFDVLPKRVVSVFVDEGLLVKSLSACSAVCFRDIACTLQQWTMLPHSTEGYRVAEVTVGGVDCDAISSKTMEVKKIKGLYFIGEVLDLTGQLGGYNLQWAWSSGWCAGQYV